MIQHLPSITEQGGTVLVITPSQSSDLQAVLAEHPLPLMMVSDPTRDLYRAFGLMRGSATMFFSPRIIGSYLRKMWQGWRIRKPRKGEDLLQLGGDFVLDSHHRLTYAYRSQDPADRPPVQDILQALASADHPQSNESK